MKVYVVVLNWNGKDFVEKCLDSLQEQSYSAEIVVVDNGSTDGSMELIEGKYPDIHLIKESRNHGFDGGVNIGIEYAIKNGADAVALFNNDAIADKNWLKELQKVLASNKNIAAVTPKLLSHNGRQIDSTGDLYCTWGLTIARQRDETAKVAFNEQEEVFGACAGASLYRVAGLKDIGFFDEKFFAYYEDTDLSFRLQLRGWKIIYCPAAIADHATGSTSSRISGFTTYQTMKNLPMLFWKDVPAKLLLHMAPRFFLAYHLIFLNSLFHKGRRWPAIKGYIIWIKNIPYTIGERRKIQKNRKVSNEYIWSILLKDLPPDATRLRRFRSFFTRT